MMTDLSSNQIEALLQDQANIAFVKVDGDGKHYAVTVVSDEFIDKPKVKRQLWVYALLNPYIVSGALHAIQLNTWTQAEWQKICAERGSEE
jgi:acid stress-induced BolA-like protein IbaG/YrbA